MFNKNQFKWKNIFKKICDNCTKNFFNKIKVTNIKKWILYLVE